MKRVAILGAGPLGLEAALAAADHGLDSTLYEVTESVAGNVRSWGHVRLFTPWSMNVSARARRHLEAAGVEAPEGSGLPTGEELVDRLLRPLAGLPAVSGRVRYGAEVIGVGRDGPLKHEEIGTGRRARHPFRMLLRGVDGAEEIASADVVLDCTGTYHNPNALGVGGIPAPGERAAGPDIVRGIPDVVGEPSEWSGRSILLVGAGHSAQTAARDLAELVRAHPDTHVTWAIRGEEPDFGAVEDDVLLARASLVAVARDLAFGDRSPLDVKLGRSVHALEPSDDRITVTLRAADGSTEAGDFDRIVALTGSVGDAGLYRQLQVHECWATSGPMKLASALLGSSSADCLTQTGHGPEALINPEPDFFILGSKSYGRNNTFLMRVGWEQVDDVFSLYGVVHAAGAVR